MKCRRIWQVPHAKEIIACVASSDNSIHTVIRISSLCSPTVPLILFQQMPWEAAKPTTQKWSWKKKACIADTTAQMEDEFGGDVFFFIFLMKMKAIKGLIIPY